MKVNNLLPKSFYSILMKAISDKSYGSIEIYIQAGEVTQITERTIRKIKQPDNLQNGKSLLTTP